MKLRNLIAIIVIVLTGFNLSFSQWSQDPTEAMNAEKGEVISDSMGGVFLATTTWTIDAPRAYCRWVNCRGEIPWEDWIDVCPAATGSEYALELLTSEPGILIVTFIARWIQDEDTTYDIRAQKINTDGELLWGRAGMPIISRAWSEIDSGSSPISIVTDDEGGAIIPFLDYRTYPEHLLGQRLDSEGEMLWGEGGVVINDEIPPPRPALGDIPAVTDGNGGMIVNFYVPDSFYVQKIDRDGNLRWGEDGVWTVVENRVDIFDAVPDGKGGVILGTRVGLGAQSLASLFRINTDGRQVWGGRQGLVLFETHYLNTVRYLDPMILHISENQMLINWNGVSINVEPRPRVQSITIDGEILWEPEGRHISNSDSFQFNMYGVASDINSAIYAWFDRRDVNGESESIFIQRIDSEGNRLWDEDDVLLYNHRATEVGRIITDCQGGAIVAFGRGGLRLQHINRNGELGVPLAIRGFDQPLAPGMIEYSIFPNPTNSSTTLQFSNPLLKSTTLKIYDLQGRLVYSSQLNAGAWSQVVDVAVFPAGSYLLRMKDEGGRMNLGKRLVLVK